MATESENDSESSPKCIKSTSKHKLIRSKWARIGGDGFYPRERRVFRCLLAGIGRHEDLGALGSEAQLRDSAQKLSPETQPRCSAQKIRPETPPLSSVAPRPRQKRANGVEELPLFALPYAPNKHTRASPSSAICAG